MTTIDVFNTTDVPYTDPENGTLITGRTHVPVEHTEYVERLIKLDVLYVKDDTDNDDAEDVAGQNPPGASESHDTDPQVPGTGDEKKE